MADKLKSAMRGKSKRARFIRCFGVLIAVMALFAATASWAVADNEGKIQNLSITWSSRNSGDGVTVNGDSLSLTPQSAKTDASGTKATATVSFTVSDADSTTKIQADQFEMRLPAHIFKNRDGKTVGSFTLPSSISPSKDGVTGLNKLYYTYDEATDEIVIRNATEFESNPTITFDVIWDSTNSASDNVAASGPRNIRNGYTNTDPDADPNTDDKIAIKATTKLDQNGVTEDDSSKELSVTYNTSSDYEIKKKASEYQFNWDETWGTNPDSSDNGDKYVYTVWEVTVDQNDLGTQPYKMTVTDKPEDGDVVWCSLPFTEGKPETTEWTVDPADTEVATSKTITYVVRHKKPEDTSKAFTPKNIVNAKMTWVDKKEIDRSADATFPISTLDFKYDGAGPGINKTSYETHREGAINAIENAKVGEQPSLIKEFRYNIEGAMRGGSLTREKDETSADLSAYGKRSYSVELTDDLLVLGDEQLTDDDYEIEQITVGDRTETAYKKDGSKYVATTLNPYEWCQDGSTKDADGNVVNAYSANDPKTEGLPTADVYVRFAKGSAEAEKFGTDYVKYGTVTYGVDGENSTTVSATKSHFTPVDAMKDMYMEVYGNSHKKEDGSVYEWYGAGNTRLPLELPRHVTGAQIKWSSKNYSTKMLSTILVNLHATDHIKSIVSGKPAINLVNVNSLRAFDPDGEWFLPLYNNTNIEGNLSDLVSKRDEAIVGGDKTAYMFHAAAQDELQSYSGHTSIYKGGRSTTNDSKSDDGKTTSVAFGSYKNGEETGYEGLYYLDMADWSSVDEKDVGGWNGERFLNDAINRARDKNLLTEQKEGTFYDLLPAGMTVDPSSVKVWKKKLERVNENARVSDDEGEGVDGTPAIGKVAHSYAWREKNEVSNTRYKTADFQNARCDSSVEFIQNWHDTGRTMMVVHAAVKDDSNMGALAYLMNSTQYRHIYVYSGFHVEFEATYTTEALEDYGENFRNSVAYMGKKGSTLWDGLKDDPSSLSDAQFKDNGVMYDVDGDDVYGEGSTADKNVVYAEETSQITDPASSVASSTKRVMDEHDSTWKTETVTTQAGSYRYRLRTKAPHDLKNVIFYDAIERNVLTDSITADSPKRWYGTLESVDVSQAKYLGIAPVVYYTESADLSSMYTKDTEQANANTVRALDAKDSKGNAIWVEASQYSNEHGGDLSAVTGVAVDLSTGADGKPFTIEKDKSVSIYLNMKAPGDTDECKGYHDANARAVNRWIQSSDQDVYNDGNFTHRLTPIDPVQVSINAEVADFTFTKVDSVGNALSGAKFKLFKWVGSGQAPAGKSTIDASNPGNDWKLVDSREVTSDDKGAVGFTNLAKGTYRLVETKAPDGYVLPSGQWQVKVNPSAETGVGTGKQIQIEAVGENQPPAFATKNSSLSLPNYKPFELPVSGGWGLVGIAVAALALIAVGVMLSRFRRNNL